MCAAELPESVKREQQFQLRVTRPEHHLLLEAVRDQYPHADGLRDALFQAIARGIYSGLEHLPETSLLRGNLKRLRRGLIACRAVLLPVRDERVREIIYRSLFARHLWDHIGLARMHAEKHGTPFSAEEIALLGGSRLRSDARPEAIADPEDLSPGIVAAMDATEGDREDALRLLLMQYGEPSPSQLGRRVSIRLRAHRDQQALALLLARFPNAGDLSDTVFSMLEAWLDVKDDEQLPLREKLMPRAMWHLPLLCQAAREALQDIHEPALRKRVYAAQLQVFWMSYSKCFLGRNALLRSPWSLCDMTAEEEDVLGSLGIGDPGGCSETRYQDLAGHARDLFLEGAEPWVRGLFPEVGGRTCQGDAKAGGESPE